MKYGITTSLLCIGLFAGELTAAEVRLRRTAAVSGGVVTLADVATVLDSDAKTAAALKSVVLGPAPQPGETERFNYADIRSRMRIAGVDLASVRLTGRGNIMVTRLRVPAIKTVGYRQSTSLSRSLREKAEERLNNAIANYIERVAPSLGKLEIRTSVATGDVATVLNSKRSTFRFSGFRPPLQSRQILNVQFTDTAGKPQKVSVRCDIESKPYVVAAKYTISRGTVIRDADLSLVQVDAVKDAIARPNLVVGTEAKRTIRKGAIIKRGDFRGKPLIRRNQMVYVVARRAGIAITRRMKSRGEGALGDFITVYDPKSREEISVRITGNIRAEVANDATSTTRSRNDDIVFRRASRSAKRKSTTDRLRRYQVKRYDEDRNAGRQR